MASRNEILLGKLALQREYLSRSDLQSAIEFQEAQAPGTPLGTILVEHGFLGAQQLAILLDDQKRVLEHKDTRTGLPLADALFGKRVVAQKLATEEQVNEAIRAQEEYRVQGKNLGLGEVLVARKVLTPRQVKQVLEGQKVRILACPNCGKSYNVNGYAAEKKYTCKNCKVELGMPPDSQMIVAIRTTGTQSAPQPQTGAPGPGEPRPELRQTELPRLGETAHDVGFHVTPPAETTDELCGRTIGGYRIDKKLGQGGMGIIYKAEQLSLNRIVALKMLNESLSRNQMFLARFQNEARSVAQLNHPNIVQIYDVGTAEGRHFFSMEYVEGENVGSVLDRQGKLPIQKAVEIMIQISQALIEAHGRNIVHRDIKPDNIMLSLKGVAKLADLGIAKTIELQKKGSKPAEREGAIGTPYYISPEQAQDAAAVDCRADVYSLGASLYHMLTSRVPFYGMNPAVIFMKLAREEPPDPLKYNPLIPYSLSLVLKKMMEKDPVLRYQTAEELHAAVQGVLEEIKDPKKKKKSNTFRLSREVVKIEAKETDTSALQLLGDDEPAAGAKPPHPDTASRPAAAPGAEGTAPRPMPAPAKDPSPVTIVRALGAIGVLLVVLGAGVYFASRPDRDADPPPVNGSGGDATPEDAADRKALQQLDDFRRDTERLHTHAQLREQADRIRRFAETLPAAQSSISAQATKELERIDRLSDDLLFNEIKETLLREAKLGTDQADFRAAARLLESGGESMITPGGEALVADRLRTLRLESAESVRRGLESHRDLESRLLAAPDASSRRAISGAATDDLTNLSARVLPEDATGVDARRLEIERFRTDLEGRLDLEARLARARLEIETLRRVEAAHSLSDPEAARAAVAGAFAPPEAAALVEAQAAALARIDAAAEAALQLRKSVARLVEGQVPFTFDRPGSASIAVQKYGKWKPEEGIVIYSREPASIVEVDRLTIDCYGRMLGASLPIDRPEGKASLALYLLTTGPERREEALALLRGAVAESEAVAARDGPFLFAHDYGRLEEATARAEERGLADQERRRRWDEVGTLLESLRAGAGSALADRALALQPRFEEIAGRVARGE